MTARTLQKAMPGLSAAKAQLYAPLLSKAMREGKITTAPRAAAFLAQLGHESISLTHMQEIGGGFKYEGRTDLGNVFKGDGHRYMGRGWIQLTGRANYRSYGKALGLPLEAKPHLAERPDVAARVAVAYWNSRGLSKLADKGQFDAITKGINGGLNGAEDRRVRWRSIKRLGSDILPARPDPLRHLTERERTWVDRYFWHLSEADKAQAAGDKAAVQKNRNWARWYKETQIRPRRLLLWTAGRKQGWKEKRRGARHLILFRLLKGWSLKQLQAMKI